MSNFLLICRREEASFVFILVSVYEDVIVVS